MRRTLRGGFELDDDRERIDRDEVHRFLSEECYWARGRARAVVDGLLDVSQRLVGLYDEAAGNAVSAARSRTASRSRTSRTCTSIRSSAGRGLGVELVRYTVDEGPFANARWFLNTDDAHELYRRFGFGAPDATVMTRPRA